MLIKVGARGSDLSLAQVEIFKQSLLSVAPSCELELVVIKTSGDSKQGKGEAIARDKKDWVLELEEALCDGQIDVALHSAKDVPIDINPKTEVHSVLTRARPQDVFIGKKTSDGSRLRFSDLGEGDVVGTASLRRCSQVKLANPNLSVEPLRGNVPTRIKKLDESSDYQGIVLAAAGVERLGVSLDEFEVLPVDMMLPAVNQGVLSVQYVPGNQELEKVLMSLVEVDVEASFVAERAVVAILEADCSSSLAVYSEVSEGDLELHCKVFGLSSKKQIELKGSSRIEGALELARQIAAQAIEQGAKELLNESKESA